MKMNKNFEILSYLTKKNPIKNPIFNGFWPPKFLFSSNVKYACTILQVFNCSGKALLGTSGTRVRYHLSD